MLKTVICYKTHIINKIILDFVKKIQKDCKEYNSQLLNNFKGDLDIDFFLLIPVNLEKEIPQYLKNHVKIYEESEISKLYTGFYSSWLSNHFIELWFYKNFGDKYEHFWFLDYDVRILGESIYFWNNKLTEDLLIPKNMSLVDPNWKFADYIHESFLQNERYMCYKQMYRISKALLNKLDELFKEGINGHSEIIIGSICKKYNFSYDYSFLNHRVQGIWTHNPDFSKYNIETYNKLTSDIIVKPYIFHPIKIMNYEEKKVEIESRGKYERKVNIEKIIQEDIIAKKQNITVKKIEQIKQTKQPALINIIIEKDKEKESIRKKILIKKKI